MFIALSLFIYVGYTVAGVLGILTIGENYHYIPKWNSIISITSDLITSIIILLGIVVLLVIFIANSAAKSKHRLNGESGRMLQTSNT